jgi:signal transduction histidine kinase
VPWLSALGITLGVASLYCLGVTLAPRDRSNALWRILLLYWLPGEITAVYFVSVFEVPFNAPGNGLSAWVLLSTNGFISMVWYGIGHLAASLLRRDWQLMRDLSQKAAQVANLRIEAKQQLSRELSSLRSTIVDQIATVIAKIANQIGELTPSSSPNELANRAAEIRSLCDGQVRELSHQVAKSPLEPQLSGVAENSRKRVLRLLAIDATKIESQWFWVSSIGTINAVTLALQLGGWSAAALALAAIGAGVLALNVLDGVRHKFLPNLSAPRAALLVVSQYLGLSALGTYALSFIGQGWPEINRFAQSIYVIVPLVILILWLLTQAIRTLSNALRVHSDQLVEGIQELEAEVGNVREQSLRTRKRLSKLLHGTTQGRLASVSLALTAAAANNDAGEIAALVEQAKSQLAIAEEELEETLNLAEVLEVSNLKSEIESLRDGWLNLVDLRFEISPEAEQVVSLDANLLASIIEAMRECITNAIRHGNATTVYLQVTKDEALVLRATNDGRAVESIEPGFGIRAIAESATKIEIGTEGSLTSVTVRWPI